MAQDQLCDCCGAPLARADNVVPLRMPQSAGPPQLDMVELGEGQVRLRVNLVVPREAAYRVLAELGEAD